MAPDVCVSGHKSSESSDRFVGPGIRRTKVSLLKAEV